jgi:Family of unknown function (DUF5675)
MKATLTRLADDGFQTLGIFQSWDGIYPLFSCKTLELPYLGNRTLISCIPKGTYEVKKHNSPTFGKCFKLFDVPGRTDILIHKGNFNKDTKGCILVGKDFIDINEDGTTDISCSTGTFEKMFACLPEEFELKII